MSWGPRTTALFVLGVTLPWLAACGSGDPQQAVETPVVIPGSTVTIGVDTGAPASPPEAPSSGSVATAADLVAKIGGAMGEYGTVRNTTTTGGATQVSDYDYAGNGSDYVSRPEGDGRALQEYRKVGEELYYLPVDSDEWQVFTPGEAPAELEQLLTEARAYNLLEDLSRQFRKAQDFAFAPDGPTEVDGTAVETYSFTLQPADLASAPGTAEALPQGTVDVLFSVDTDGLPVQATYDFADASQAVGVFDGWGDDVEVTVPDVG